MRPRAVRPPVLERPGAETKARFVKEVTSTFCLLPLSMQFHIDLVKAIKLRSGCGPLPRTPLRHDAGELEEPWVAVHQSQYYPGGQRRDHEGQYPGTVSSQAPDLLKVAASYLKIGSSDKRAGHYPSVSWPGQRG